MSTATVLGRTARAEWARIWTVRSSWILVGLTAFAVLGIGALTGFDGEADAPRLATAWEAGLFLTFFALFGGIALSVLAATSDYGTGGIIPTLQWTPRRGVLLLARTTVIVATVAVVSALLVSGGSWLIAAIADRSLTGAVGSLAVTAYVCGAGALLAVGLGLLTRSSAGALVTALALMLILPLVMFNLPYDWSQWVAERLPGTGALFLIFGNGPPTGSMTPTSARVTLAIWALAALAAGGWRLLRTDANR